MSKAESVRTMVSERYAESVKQRMEGQPGGCCAPSPTTDARAGFAQAENASFGCGSPLPFAEVKPGQTVVDLGSGAGLDLMVAAEKVGPTGRVIGVDMTDEMLAAAEKNVTAAGLKQVELRKGIIEELPVEANSVDWLMSNCVINLSPEKERVFAEIHRVLKPGGRFSISDIVAEGLPDWITSSASAYSGCVAGAISEADYVAGLEKAGLSDVEVVHREVYGPAQVRVAAKELLDEPVPDELLEEALKSFTGTVQSIRVVGRKA